MPLLIICMLMLLANPHPSVAAGRSNCEHELVKGRRGYRWNEEIIVKAIRDIETRGLPVNFNSIRKLTDPENSARITSIVGFQANGATLFKAAYRQYGSWDKALLAAGIEPDPQRLLIQWNPELIVTVIRELRDRHIPLNYFAVRQDRQQRVSDYLFERFKKRIAGNGLVAAATNHFGSWDEALIAAGLDPRDIRPQNSWTPRLVVQGIQAMHAAGLSLHAAALERNTSDDVAKIIATGTGFHATAAALIDRGYQLFPGKWDEALTAAGLDPVGIRRRGSMTAWSDSLIIECIQTLHAAGVGLNWQSLIDSNPERLNAVLLPVVGSQITAHALLGSARNHFGTWSDALRAAGLNPTEHRVHRSWSKADVENLIRVLHAQGLPLNSNYIKLDPEGRILLTLSLANSRFVGGAGFIVRARQLFGDWATALEAAGLDPDSIYLRRPRGQTSHVDDSIVSEWITDASGESRMVSYVRLGSALPDAHTLLEQKEEAATLENALADLKVGDERIVRAILAVFENDEALDIDQLSEVLSQQLNERVMPAQIREIFADLARDERLREML